MSEIYMWGVAGSFLVLGAKYNAVLVIQGVVVAFGLSILVRGVLGTAEARKPGAE
ncbi:MAG: hypothetical protein NVSMB3_08520 [Acidobacteriaceae bacterium]